jgi:hypothetical protein
LICISFVAKVAEHFFIYLMPFTNEWQLFWKLSVQIICPLIIFYVFIFGGTQGCTLARQELYHWSHAPSPFCISYFLKRVLLLCLHSNLPIHTSYVAGMTGTCTTMPSLYCLRCGLTFAEAVPQSSWSLPPKKLGLQAWVATHSSLAHLLIGLLFGCIIFGILYKFWILILYQMNRW